MGVSVNNQSIVYFLKKQDVYQLVLSTLLCTLSIIPLAEFMVSCIPRPSQSDNILSAFSFSFK